jgi:tellurite resistance protein
MPSPSPLKFLQPAWFSLVMGLSGMALAWQAATPLLGEMASGVALVTGGLAALVFVALAVASLRRWQRHAQALEEDLKHPVRHAFVATIPVSLLLLATLAHTLGLNGWGVVALWWAGSLLQWWATLWVLGRWLSALPGGSQPVGAGAAGHWSAVTPVLFIPVVGNVVAPLAGVGLGHDLWSAAQFGVGLLFWPVVLTLTLARRIAHSPLPERLMPTWAITMAPPAVVGLCLLAFGAPVLWAAAVWGMALFSLLWVGAQGKRLISQPFSLTFWAMSFPLAAFTTLTLKLASTTGHRGFQSTGMVLLAITSLVLFGLMLATVRGLRDGTLLAPEPVAQIVPADSASTPSR